MQLSPNFQMDEFLLSQTAERNGIDMTPPPEVRHNLQWLVLDFLQPIRTEADSPLNISSGYRPPVLNKMIGGSDTSAHRFGRAADFTIAGLTPYEAVELIVRMELDFDQLIYEFGRWVHLGIAEVPRRQLLTAKRDLGRVVYLEGLQEI